MENNSNSGVIYQGKIPNRVKYCFAFGALGKDLIYYRQRKTGISDKPLCRVH